MMSWLDLLILSLVIFSAVMGWRRGLVRQLFDLVSVIASYIVALRYGTEFILLIDSYIPLFRWLPEWLNDPTPFGFALGDLVLRLLGFFVVYSLVRLLFRAVGELMHGIFSLPVLGTANGFGGMVLGALKGFLLVLLLVAVAQLIGTPFLEKTLRESTAASYIVSIWPVVYEQMVNIFLNEATQFNRVI
jgi:membrane protein required for colicin V production